MHSLIGNTWNTQFCSSRIKPTIRPDIERNPQCPPKHIWLLEIGNQTNPRCLHKPVATINLKNKQIHRHFWLMQIRNDRLTQIRSISTLGDCANTLSQEFLSLLQLSCPHYGCAFVPKEKLQWEQFANRRKHAECKRRLPCLCLWCVWPEAASESTSIILSNLELQKWEVWGI